MNNQYLMKVYPAGRGQDVYRNIETLEKKQKKCLKQ